MSSTPKRFTRYDAEHHDPATEYVLASEHDARLRDLEATQYGSGRLEELRTERNELARLRDTLTRDLEAAQRQLAALSYPVENPTNPLLTVESGGIRYVLEVMSDEDGDWFEVKSATPTWAQTLADFTHSARPDRLRHIEAKARTALAAYRAASRGDDEANRGF